MGETSFVTGAYACRKLFGSPTRAFAARMAKSASPEGLLREAGRGCVYRCRKLLRMARGGDVIDAGPGWVLFERVPQHTHFHVDEWFGEVDLDQVVTLPAMHVSRVKHIFLKDDFSIDLAHSYALPLGGSVLVARSTFQPDDRRLESDLGSSYVIVKSYTKWDYVKNDEYLAILRPGFSVKRNYDFVRFFRGEIGLPPVPF
ncbi:MAG: hypothetical protein KC609_09870 [Myxococcales bacterium]|nr:hypothetical protein [Myxococcales bacterium]